MKDLLSNLTKIGAVIEGKTQSSGDWKLISLDRGYRFLVWNKDTIMDRYIHPEDIDLCETLGQIHGVVWKTN